jgi:hypothetical protein
MSSKRAIKNNVTNIIKITLAIWAVAAERPVNPNAPAIIEISRNNKTQRSITSTPYD